MRRNQEQLLSCILRISAFKNYDKMLLLVKDYNSAVLSQLNEGCVNK